VVEADDDIGDLDAGVVDVVLDFDGAAIGAQHADEGIAEDGVAEVADVGGFIGVDVGVFDDDLAGGLLQLAGELEGDGQGKFAERGLARLFQGDRDLDAVTNENMLGNRADNARFELWKHVTSVYQRGANAPCDQISYSGGLGRPKLM
jgi:hypothetical protein